MNGMSGGGLKSTLHDNFGGNYIISTVHLDWDLDSPGKVDWTGKGGIQGISVEKAL